MNIANLYIRAIDKLKEEGVKCTIIDAITLLYDHYFDIKYNFDTNKWVTKEELIKEYQLGVHATLYQAAKALPLRKLFKQLKIPREKVLIDLGSGKGRVLFIASKYGFKEVRGVEFSKHLCDITKANIAKYKRKVKNEDVQIDVIQIDAAKYVFKDDEDIIFMYNPFDEFILEQVADNISASLKRNKRDLLVIYANPCRKHMLERKMTIKKCKDYIILNNSFTVYQV